MTDSAPAPGAAQLPAPRVEQLPDPAPLLSCFERNKRDLPWRRDSDPYKIWVSEIMLQQTRAGTVIPYFERFIERLPDLVALAEISEHELLKLWEGLGYYNRARNMQKAARQLLEQGKETLPDHYLALKELPGIREYTAGAIASLAFGERVPAVDGNVVRVLARLLEREWTQGNVRDRAEARRLTQAWLDQSQAPPGRLNEALIELGATVCRPRQPRCVDCPLEADCLARAAGRERDLPLPKKAKAVPVEELTFVILNAPVRADLAGRGEAERWLVGQRPGSGLLANFWTVPVLDGKCSPAEAAALLDEAGWSSSNVAEIGAGRHVFSHLVWDFNVLEARLDRTAKERIPAGAASVAGQGLLPDQGYWLSADELRTLAFPTALHRWLPWSRS